MKCSNFVLGLKKRLKLSFEKFLPNVIKIEEINKYFFYFLGKNPESKGVRINIKHSTIVQSIFWNEKKDENHHSIKGNTIWDHYQQKLTSPFKTSKIVFYLISLVWQCNGHI